MGVNLFDRHNGKLFLNQAGQLFLSRVENVFTELDNGLAELSLYKQKRQNWIYVASSVIDIFYSIMSEYYKLCPDIHIDHLLTAEREVARLLLDGDVDFAITCNPLSDPGLDCVPLFEEEVFALVCDSHPLYGRKEVSIAELRTYPLICNNCDSDIHFMEQLFQVDYQELNIIASSNESRIPCEMTALGHAVGIVPARIAVRHLRNNTKNQRPLRIRPAYHRTNCVVTKRARPLLSPVAELYRYVLDYFNLEAEEISTFIHAYYG